MSDTSARRRIRAIATPKDPKTMRFILDTPVQDGASGRYDDAAGDAAGDAPLVRALFAVAGVSSVEVDGASIYVSCDGSGDWSAMKPPIAAAIRDVLDTEAAPLGAVAGGPTDADAQLLQAVADLLDREANPAIASHGGSVAVERVEGGDVYLRMSGGCQGCAASSATLRQGIETMLRAAIPSIREIIDLTDHGAGTNPFYAGAQGQSPALNRMLPQGAVGWEDGQIIIDPDYLAPRLGLTPESLREGMRSGDIVSRSEGGAGADAGKTRITVRTAQRAWSAEMLPDGMAREVPPPRLSPDHSSRSPNDAQVSNDPLVGQIRQHLEGLPDEEPLISYGKLARALGFWAPGSIAKVTKALEVTMREDAAKSAPFIAARAVNRGEDRLPGKGFFELAQALGGGPVEGETERAFHDRSLAEAAAFYTQS